MKGEKLELELWEELRRPQQRPDAVQVSQILDVVEATASCTQ